MLILVEYAAIHEQSPDINQGVEKKIVEDQGAGDQGMMFGFPQMKLIILFLFLDLSTNY